MAIFITGDTHGGSSIAGIHRWLGRNKQHLTKNDYLIIAGDCGIFWCEDYTFEFRMWLSELPCTVLFIDGNHDDHWTLAGLETRNMFGADVGVACDNVFHLRRGRVYTICDKQVFTFGGALSIDKKFREAGTDWWPEEIPSQEEFERGVNALIAVDWKVDLVITHTAPRDLLSLLPSVHPAKIADSTTCMLNRFQDLLTYDHWFCGHLHKDIEHGKLRVVFQDVVEA